MNSTHKRPSAEPQPAASSGADPVLTTRRVLVLTAAYPAESSPERAVFVENLTAAMLPVDETGGWEAIVVAPRIVSTDVRREARHGIEVCRFSYVSGGRRLKEVARPNLVILGTYFLSALLTGLRSAIRSWPDVIVAHWVLPMGPIAALIAFVVRRPLVIVVHGSDINRYGTSGFLFWLRRRALARASRVVAVSQALAEQLSELGVPSELTSHVPMGVDTELFLAPGGNAAAARQRRDAARADLQISSDRPALLFVGDLIVDKGVQELATAWKELIAGGCEVDLWFVGEGPLKGCLKAELGHAAGVGTVLFPGRVPQRQLASWYHAADLFVLPSHAEGTPVAVMEALTCGLPIVASDVGGIPEVVRDGVTGRLVPARDPAFLRRTLADLLSVPEKLDRYGEELRRSPVQHSVEQRAGVFRTWLNEVCGDA